MPDNASSSRNTENITALPSADRGEKLRILEALLFAATDPVSTSYLAEFLTPDDDAAALLADLQGYYAGRGVHLSHIGGKWAFRTAEDLNWILERRETTARKLSRVALETLAIIAYHQPVTRAEIEAVRGVTTSKGTLDVLLETRWIKMRGRRHILGRPMTYGTTEGFLDHFSLETLADLPGLKELKETGLLDENLPPDFTVPKPDAD